MIFPQFRVRSEYSFREVFGPLEEVADTLQELKVTHAALVDIGGSTWGHFKWASLLAKRGIVPIFGVEVGIEGEENRGRVFALARDTGALYRMNKVSLAQKGAITLEQAVSFGDSLVWFSGSETHLDTLRTLRARVTLDPSSALLQARARANARELGATPIPLSDNYYPKPGDSSIYSLIDKPPDKPSPQYLLPRAELEALAPLTEEVTALARSFEGVTLKRAPMITVPGDLKKEVSAGVKRRGLKLTNEYKVRIERELTLIKEKDFDSYFLVVADMVRFAKTVMLVGPARGSAAGSLVCYALGITEIDPMPFGLIFERFVDVTRKDLPDIDLDFNDAKRHLVFEYMEAKYGAANVARIGTVTELKPKSILAMIGKKLKIPFKLLDDVKNASFTRSSGDARANFTLLDTLRETSAGRELLEKYPGIDIIHRLEGHASHTGVHAAGLVVCNEHVDKFCSVTPDGIVQLDKYDAEALGLLKIDALGLKTLGLLEDTHTMRPEEFYRIPLNDQPTLDVLNRKEFAGIFQWEGGALQRLTEEIPITEFMDLAHITALGRPGPLVSGASGRYISCANGEPIRYVHPIMDRYLRETKGIFLYQEQVLQVCREVGRMSWEEVTALRKAMSRSLGREFFDQYKESFMRGAAQEGDLPPYAAEGIWDEMCTFGSWGFNKSHAVSYALVSYWTAYIKAHHPLEHYAAALRAATSLDETKRLLREAKGKGFEYEPFSVKRSEVNWSVKDGKLIGGIIGIRGIGNVKAEAFVKDRDSGKLSAEDLRRYGVMVSEYDDLYPAHRMWGKYYTDPESMGIRKGSKVIELSEMPEAGDVVVVALMIKKDERDENETVRLAQRNWKRVEGNSKFVDLVITDDSSKQIKARIGRFQYRDMGRAILDKAVEGESWFLIRGKKLKGFPMISIDKMKCLTDEGMFS